jgi:hypothetical protein
MSQWFKTSEGLPQHGEPVLLWVPVGRAMRVRIATYNSFTGRWWAGVSFSASEVSHWMPLPAPPEGT